MALYSINLQAIPAQSLTAQLGANLMRIKLQWQERTQVFRVDIADAQNVPVVAGKFLNPQVDLFADIYPAENVGKYGLLTIIGDQPTPDNLGVTNTLVWTDE